MCNVSSGEGGDSRKVTSYPGNSTLLTLPSLCPHPLTPSPPALGHHGALRDRVLGVKTDTEEADTQLLADRLDL